MQPSLPFGADFRVVFGKSFIASTATSLSSKFDSSEGLNVVEQYERGIVRGWPALQQALHVIGFNAEGG